MSSGTSPTTGVAPASVHRDLFLFACACALLLPSIWSQSSISGQDEYWLSFRTVLEMRERGEWLVPYVNGEVRLQKPPLLYWLMRLAFELLGPNLLAARIWPVLAGASMVLFTDKLFRLYGGRGHLGGLLALCSAGVAVESRRAMFDLPVACLCTIAVWYAVSWGRSGRLAHLLAAACALAAAAMTKGPVALLFFAAPMLGAALFVRRRLAGPWWHLLPACLAFVVLALPWPLAIAVGHPEFWDVMQDQAENREFGANVLRTAPKMVTALFGLAIPWSVAAVCAAIAACRRGGAHGRWLVAWVGIGLLPFLLMQSFERYVLALVCPLVLLTAPWLQGIGPRTLRLQLTIATALLSLLTVLFAAVALWFGLAVWSPLSALLALALAWWSARRPEPDPARTIATLAVVLAIVLGGVYPALGINRLPEDLPTDLSTTPVATFGRPQPGMLSMVRGRSVVQMSPLPEGLGERLRAFDGYLFAMAEDASRLERAAAAAGVRLQRLGEFRSFYSRRAWLRFYRRGTRWPDWREALRSRDPAILQPVFVYYRVSG